MNKSLTNPIVIFLCLIFVLSSNVVQSQSWVADTISINFGNSALQNNPLHLQVVNDLRNEDLKFVSVFEQKKALVFPVDQIVNSKENIADCFITRFNSQLPEKLNLCVILHRFYIN